MEVLNHYHRELQLPSGLVLPPNERIVDPKWHINKKSKALRRWIDAGLIQVFGTEKESAPEVTEPVASIAPPSPVLEPQGQQSEDEFLRAELAKFGIKLHHKTGTDKLKAALEEAKAKSEESKE